MSSPLDALVIGAGVIGLTTAIRLQEAGLRVRIVADRTFYETTSANAGAIWGPFLSEVDSRVLDWSFRTFKFLRHLSTIKESGVRMVSGLGAADFSTTTPMWVHAIDGSSECDPSDLPDPYVCGWRYCAPIIDIPIYLDYLMNCFATLGGSFELRKVQTLSEVTELAAHLVVCTGLGARELLDDRSLTPSKGQLVVVENPGITEFFAERGDGPDLTYILPQDDKVVLGGTAEWDYPTAEADPSIMSAIVARCARIEPSLASCRVLGYRVGLRPCRPMVCLNHDVTHDGAHVVYNYGHGGSGVSLAWACADAVTTIILECISKSEYLPETC